MKLNEQFVIQAALALCIGTSAWGLTADPQGNPYQGIAVRNVFALKPPPDPESVKPPATPPPEIKLQGIMSAFGKQQVLFMTQLPAKPPKPAEKVSMVLSVGQGVDEIEVVAIDEKAGSVTFNNHGQPQTLTLADDSVKVIPGVVPPVAAVGGVPAPAIPGVPPPATTFSPGQPAPSTVTTFSGAKVTIPTRSLRLPGVGTSATGVTAPGTAVATTPTPQAQQQQQRPLTPEEQVVHMEVLRELHKNDPDFPPLPPTEITPNPPSVKPQ